jgi:hypothetical protein
VDDDTSLPKTGAYWLTQVEVAGLFDKKGAKPEEQHARRAAQRLLALLQQQAGEWGPLIEENTSPFTYYAPEFRDPSLGDFLLTQFAERVAALGWARRAPDHADEPLWSFAAILLPKDRLRPMSQQSLIVQAQSGGSPYRVGETTVSPTNPLPLSLHAYQGSQIVSLNHVSPNDPYLYGIQKEEHATRSAIAVPIEGEHGQALGVLYLASEEEAAFSQEDHLLLRLMGRLAGELLLTYRARDMLVHRLASVITTPDLADAYLAEFQGEEAFVQELEGWLRELQSAPQTPPNGNVPLEEKPGNREPLQQMVLAAIDIEDLTSTAYKYGDQAVKNLVRAVGKKLARLLTRHLPRRAGQEVYLYRLYVGWIYLLFRNIQWVQVQAALFQIYPELNQDFHIDPARITDEQAIPTPGDKASIPVQTRLVMNGYVRDVLKTMLEGQEDASISPGMAVNNVRARLTVTLEEGLMLTRNAKQKVASIPPGERTYGYVEAPSNRDGQEVFPSPVR